MMRPLGHVPDRAEDVKEDLRLRHVGALVGGAVGELPTVLDYSSMHDAPTQLAQSCVGWAFRTSIRILAALAGIDIEAPSAKAIYDVARLLETPRTLVDVGSRPRLALMGMQEYGLVAEQRWPETATNANTPPPLDVFRAGLGALLTGHYRIGGGDHATLARVALACGFVPFFAMPVDEPFMRLDDGSLYDGLSGPMLGSHAMALVGYGAGYFLVANSWGPAWGVRGVGRISDRVLNQLAFDIIVPTVAPKAIG